MFSELTNFLPSSLIKDLDMNLPSESLAKPKVDKTENKSSNTKLELEEDNNNNIHSESDSTISSPLNESNLLSTSLLKKYFSYGGDMTALFSKQKDALFFQGLLFKLSKFEIAQVIMLFKGKYAQIMQDPYGNYFCSDLFKIASKEQRTIILNEITADLPTIALNQYGTHPIQTLIKLSSSSYEEQKLLVKHIRSSQVIIEMCTNQNGTYVIQKILQHINDCYKCRIRQTIIDNFFLLTLDMNGVCVIKTLMQITESSYEKELFLSYFINNFIPICKSTYGNYAIQHALDLWWHLDIIKGLKAVIIKHFTQLAECRNSSHIAEMLLCKLNQRERNMFIYELLMSGKLAIIAKSKYGVFIVNQVFGFVSWSDKEFIISVLKSQLMSLSD